MCKTNNGSGMFENVFFDSAFDFLFWSCSCFLFASIVAWTLQSNPLMGVCVPGFLIGKMFSIDTTTNPFCMFATYFMIVAFYLFAIWGILLFPFRGFRFSKTIRTPGGLEGIAMMREMKNIVAAPNGRDRTKK